MSQSDSAIDNVCVADQVLFQKVDGESVLLNVTSGTYFGLDSVGTRCWEVISEFGSLRKTVDTIVSEYDVEPDRARRDLESLVAELSKHGLVQAAPA